MQGVASAGEPRRAPGLNEVKKAVGRGKRETGPRTIKLHNSCSVCYHNPHEISYF